MEQQQSTRVRLVEDQQAANSDITEQELMRRKDFLEFGDDDVANLTKINDLASQYAASVIEDFYKHLLSFEETRTFFRDPRTLQRVKNAQQDYFLRLTQGKYDLAYAQNRLVIGATHERTGLPIKSYLGMYNYYLRAVAGRLRQAFATQQDRAWSTFLSLMKLTFLDMGLAIDTYINSRERTIREQQAAIQELPTPVLPFREGMLLVPIIGLIELATRTAAYRTATGCRSRQSGKGGCDRHNGCSRGRFEGRKSHGANG